VEKRTRVVKKTKKVPRLHDFRRDCEAIACAIERSRGWSGPGLQAQLAAEFRHPTPETFIRNVATVLRDNS
jgi:hypothetical protein